MRPEDAAKLGQLRATLGSSFGVPSLPDAAIDRVLVATAALWPIAEVATDEQFTMIVSDWMDPMVIDVLERVQGALNELYDVLESAADDTQILEPGTIANQQFTDLPVVGGGTALPGPSGVPRGDLIR